MDQNDGNPLTLVNDDIEKPVGDQELSSLCDQCRKFELRLANSGQHEIGTTGELSENSTFYITTSLGKLRASEEYCSLCNLLVRCILHHDPGAGQSSQDAKYTLVRRENNSALKHDPKSSWTTALQLSWKPTTARMDTIVHIFPVHPESCRRVPNDTTADFLRSCLDDCTTAHDSECAYNHETQQEFLQLIEGTAFGVIDVHEMRLKSLPCHAGKHADFAALSYVWGDRQDSVVASYQTTCMNVLDRIRPGGLAGVLSLLPKTIRDAIQLVKEAGLSYLWVDSLCIVQDSYDSWLLIAEAMHLIYANAHFTICACDGDSSTGLKDLELSTSRPQLTLASETSTTDGCGRVMTHTLGDDTLFTRCSPSLAVLAMRSAKALFTGSAWSTRAW